MEKRSTYRSNTYEFIEKARKVHGDKYDYSKVEYVNNKTKVCIICPEHGEFWQNPNMHLRRNGCPLCSKIINKEREFLIFLYIYSAYENTRDKKNGRSLD